MIILGNNGERSNLFFSSKPWWWNLSDVPVAGKYESGNKFEAFIYYDFDISLLLDEFSTKQKLIPLLSFAFTWILLGF